MSAKVISSGTLHLLPKSDHQQTTLFTPPSSSHLGFKTSVAKPISLRRQFSLKTSSKSSTSARGATVKAFYVQTQTPETFYDLLGISESGTISDIKKAYKQLARKYHPDVSPPESAEENTKKFIMVQEAYETLSDPQSRAVYDLDLARGLHLPFSSRRRSSSGEGSGEEWKMRWQTQLNNLKKRAVNKESGGKASWGDRMRRGSDHTIFDLSF